MKDFSQYASVEDVVRDLVSEGIIARNKKIRELFPDISRKPKSNYVEKFKASIIDAIKTSNCYEGKISLSKLSRALRADNNPDEFKIAVHQLIEEKKIVEEKLQTGKAGRPYVHYLLWQF